jgi:hypothetical protein
MTEAAIRRAFASAGVNLVYNSDEGPGLRITDEGVIVSEDDAEEPELRKRLGSRA